MSKSTNSPDQSPASRPIADALAGLEAAADRVAELDADYGATDEWASACADLWTALFAYVRARRVRFH